MENLDTLERQPVATVLVKNGPHAGVWIREIDALSDEAMQAMAQAMQVTDHPLRHKAKTLLEMMAGRLRVVQQTGNPELQKAIKEAPALSMRRLIKVANAEKWDFLIGLVVVGMAERHDV